MLNEIYKIEISLNKQNTIYHGKPYYWILWKKHDDFWVNTCTDWARSPDEAWTHAYSFYQAFKSKDTYSI